MAILKIKDAEGNIVDIPCIKGDKGDAYVLTDADKQEIAEMVVDMMTNGDGVAY